MSPQEDPRTDGPPPLLGRGFHWQQLREGQRSRAFRRTVTETDLVSFVSAAGIPEPVFVDATHEEGAMGPRPVPAAIHLGAGRGHAPLRALPHGAGLAPPGAARRAPLPVRVGDTVGAEVAVTGVRPASRGGRGVVSSGVAVPNRRGERAMTCTATRLVAGAPPDG